MLDSPKLTPLQMIRLGLKPSTLAEMFVSKIDTRSTAYQEYLAECLEQRFRDFPTELAEATEAYMDMFGHTLSTKELAQHTINEMCDLEAQEFAIEIVEKSCLEDPTCMLGYIESIFADDIYPTHADTCTYATMYGASIRDLQEALETSAELRAVVTHVVADRKPHVFPTGDRK